MLYHQVMKRLEVSTALCITVYLFAFLIWISHADAQQEAIRQTDVEALQAMSQRLRIESQQKKAIAIQAAQQRGWPIRLEIPDGAVIELQELREDGMPVYYTTHNLDAADTVSTDELWPGGASGLGLTGTGSTLGVWDGGGVLVAHQEFSGRVMQKDLPEGTNWHSTHVAGTMIAAGAYPDAKGMSFQGQLDAYDWGEDESEMASAAASGLRVSNHSYGYIRGWYYDSGWWYWFGNPSVASNEDYLLGFYDEHAETWDGIAFDAPFYLIVKSAGNDRNEGPDPGTQHRVWDWEKERWVQSTDTREKDGGDDGYDCIGTRGTAKNILTVGAVDDIAGGYSSTSDVVMSSFSCWGPTDDGRIKPDIVANGVGLVSCHDYGVTYYTSASGTSMSSPNASGSLGLLMQHYRNLHGSDMRASTLKALVIHTADEAGAADGPDYEHGWGLLNTEKAAQVISLDALPTPQSQSIEENSLANGEEHTFYLTSNGTEPLKVTIAWTDPPGTPPSPSLNPLDKMLVNDLDLRVSYDGSDFLPWTLSPTSPANAATAADNDVDNVEQVFLASPVSGSYAVSVSHKGTLADGNPQDYSMIVTGGEPEPTLVKLATFTVSASDGKVTLYWRTETELDNVGFAIHRGDTRDGNYTRIAFVAGAQDSETSNDYQFMDEQVRPGHTYYYYLEDVDLAGGRTKSDVIQVSLPVSLPVALPTQTELEILPERNSLLPNYPNPFNPATWIPYNLAEAADVTIQIYDVWGRLIRTLHMGHQPAGFYSGKDKAAYWDGQDNTGKRAGSGVYFYRLSAGSFSAIRKMVIQE